MRYLFLDNFRGFSDTYIPLLDVNFLVGENSTGKTSLLTVVRMFSSPKMFMGADLAGDDVNLGHFSEVVSAHARNKSYFRLGVVQDRPSGKKNTLAATGLLLTYVEERGLPKISRITYSIEDREVNLRLDGDLVFYKNEAAPRSANAAELRNRIPAWIDQHVGPGNNWTELIVPDEFKNGQFPIYFLLSLAAHQPTDSKNSKGFPLLLPQFGPSVVWIAPIRTAPRRSYDEPHTAFSSEGSHTPYVIRRMLSSEDEAKKFKDFISRVGEASGLFQKIDIKYFGDPADTTSPFEVDAYLDDKALSLGWLGYGVSQSLPIFVELLDRPKGSWFAIQQPEVHLHPRAQACLGDVFFEMAAVEGKGFLIETHSDFTIDRFRMNYRRKRPKRDLESLPQSQVLFFERRRGGNVVTQLPIGARGEMPSSQPDGYRDFFVKEQLQLIGG